MLKNLVYFGSPDLSSQILESVIDSKMVNVVGVVTTPDKPLGRKQILTPSPVSLTAQKYDLPIYKPAKLDDTNLTHIKLLKPDIFMVVSYGKIIPLTWINAPTIGTYNVHFSLLPKYRGALCISETIKNQDKETGVTLMEMDEQMDHGPIIDQQRINIEIDDDVATLTTKLTQVAKEILRHKLPEICAQNYSKMLQDESLAVFTPSHQTVSRESAFIPWETISSCLYDSSSLRVSVPRTEATPAIKGQNCAVLHALIRSLNPQPGAWTKIDDLEIKLIKTSLNHSSLRGGTPTRQSHSMNLTLDTVQLSGKIPISWKQFLSGHPLPVE